MTKARRKFTWLLPALALAITFVALALPISISLLRFYTAAKGAAAVRYTSGPFQITLE